MSLLLSFLTLLSVVASTNLQWRTDPTSPNLYNKFAMWSPGDGQTHPAVVVLFGGAWMCGAYPQVQNEATWLAQNGYVAFAPEYRLAPWSTNLASNCSGNQGGPAYHASDQSDDVAAFVQYVKANAATYHVDPNRIAVWGGSSGAHLALMLGAQGLVQADLSFSGPSDPAYFATDPGINTTQSKNSLNQVTWLPCDNSAHTCRTDYNPAWNYLGCDASACPDQWAANSPVSLVTSASAPTMIVNSAYEIMPVSQADHMAQALAAAGVPYTETILPGSGHAWDYWTTEQAPALAFLRQYLGT